MHEHTWRRYALYDGLYARTTRVDLAETQPDPHGAFYVGYDCACGEQGYSVA